MDAFFASVELLRHPELLGKPLVVGGNGSRGVVAAASYEARSYGIHSAMSSHEARKRCKELVFLSGDHPHYQKVSKRIMKILRGFTPILEPLSLDEAFLDVQSVRRLHGEAENIAYRIRSKIFEDEGLTCSVGVSINKFLAKLASEHAKPKVSTSGPVAGFGVFVLNASDVDNFLAPLPVRAVWGVGPQTLKRLQLLGIETVGDLSRVSMGTLISHLGKSTGEHFWKLSRGLDERQVIPNQEAKSIGHEETFAQDLKDIQRIHRELIRLADAVVWRLRQSNKKSRTVTLKVRYPDFKSITRSHTFAEPTSSSHKIIEILNDLLLHLDLKKGVRLIGVSVSNLTLGSSIQLQLESEEIMNWEQTEEVMDRIRGRFGASSIGPASIVGPEGYEGKNQRDQQWGPK